MPPEAVIAVSGTVVLLVEIAKASRLPRRWGPLAALVFSFIGVGSWAYSNGGVPRELVFSYLTAWANVTLGAIGAFEVVKHVLTRGTSNSNDDPPS